MSSTPLDPHDEEEAPPAAGEAREPPQSAGLPAAGEASPQPAEEAEVTHRSAMTPRFNFLFRWFANRFFRHFELDPKTVERLRGLEGEGAVVYVMRYSSRLD